jgi:hypothetical protein
MPDIPGYWEQVNWFAAYFYSVQICWKLLLKLHHYKNMQRSLFLVKSYGDAEK